MAYHLTYFVRFNNKITENIFLEIYRKDIVPSQVTELRGTQLSKRFINGDGNRFDPIISSELNVGIFIGKNDPIDFDDILVSLSDEWKVILKNDSQVDFVGFLVPGECNAAFRDKPYDIELTATDGLGYLKDIPLTNTLGDEFLLSSHLIEYIAGALKKTLLDLDIRTYCNIYESSMVDRGAPGGMADMLNQARLDYRTFQVDPITYVSCWDALRLILNGGFNLFQWYGKWVVLRCGEMQGVPGPKIYYTDYDSFATPVSGGLITESPAQVAKQQILHPVNADQNILSKLANKSVKYSYDYTPWPEIPKNNKFERGVVYEQGDVDASHTYKKSTISNWVYGVTIPSSPSTFPPNGMLPTPDLGYRYSVYDIFGVEQSREVVLERNSDPQTGHRFLRCEKIPVKKDSKCTIGFDFKINQSGNGQMRYLMVVLEGKTGNSFRLTHAGGAVPSDGVGTLIWQVTSALRFLSKNYSTGESFDQYTAFNFTTPAFPDDGDLYVIFTSFDPPPGRAAYYRNFTFEYLPYIAGGFKKVIGDYWLTEQNLNYKDVVDESVGISDAPVEVIKGALLRDDGVTLTTKSWHRQNIAENLNYNEIQNLSRYNAFYRRMWSITGTFGGTMYHPVNDETIRLPLGFHQHFFFPNSDKLNGVYFQLVPPLSIDYFDGSINATFVECLRDGANDGNQLGNKHEFKYRF